MQQTALRSLIKNIKAHQNNKDLGATHDVYSILELCLNMAKSQLPFEQQQIIDGYEDGHFDGFKLAFKAPKKYYSAIHYFNSKYASKEVDN